MHHHHGTTDRAVSATRRRHRVQRHPHAASALGYEVEYGGGIRITPFAFDDVEAWPEFEARTHAPWAANALAALPDVLPRDVARLGFAGCPWTVGMYLIAGGTGDKEFVNTRAKVHADPEAAIRLFMRLGDIVGNLLADQVVHGGADAVQLFDTWAGLLNEATYRRFAMPATARAIEVFRERCPTRTPLIHYAKASGHLHGAIMELDIDGLSLDWRDDLRAYRASHGSGWPCKATSIRPSCTAQPKPRSAPRKRCSRPLAMRPDTSSTSGMALPQAPA